MCGVLLTQDGAYSETEWNKCAISRSLTHEHFLFIPSTHCMCIVWDSSMSAFNLFTVKVWTIQCLQICSGRGSQKIVCVCVCTHSQSGLTYVPTTRSYYCVCVCVCVVKEIAFPERF